MKTCDHCPDVDQVAMKLGLSESSRLTYCRLTHESHPYHLAFRGDMGSLLEHGRIIRAARETISPTGPVVRPEAPPAPDPSPPPTSATMTAEELEAWARVKVHGVITTGASHWESLRIVQECDYRGGQLAGVGGGCGCTATWHCMRGSGPRRSSPHEVTIAECQECTRRP